MSVFTGHTCGGGGFAGSRPLEQRKAECPACQRLKKKASESGPPAQPNHISQPGKMVSECEGNMAGDPVPLPHVPPITHTWPARNVGVNGFDYLLITCGACGSPKGSAEGCCGCGGDR